MSVRGGTLVSKEVSAMAQIGEPIKRYTVVPLDEPVPPTREPVKPPPKVPEKAPVTNPEPEPVQ
jgi:hypothetical protein